MLLAPAHAGGAFGLRGAFLGAERGHAGARGLAGVPGAGGRFLGAPATAQRDGVNVLFRHVDKKHTMHDSHLTTVQSIGSIVGMETTRTDAHSAKLLELLALIDYFGVEEVKRLAGNVETTRQQTGYAVEARRA
jgi:hypothetical protein